MAAAWVVEALQVVEDRGARLGAGREPGVVQQLALQGGEEALGDGVIEAAADRAHRGDQAGLAQAAAERQRRVLGCPDWSE
jgi:hypothetical protein